MEYNQNAFAPEAATDEPASSLNPASSRPESIESRAPEAAPAAASVPAAAGAEADPLGHPAFASEAEDSAYWRGLTAGLRMAADGAPGPAAPDPDLTRGGTGPALLSASLAAAYVPVAADPLGRAIRHDGLTPARQRAYLVALGHCGVVADACRAAGVGRDSVYDLRNRAGGRAFALAWDAALLIARPRMGDELISRAMNGVVDRIYRNGELWGERHRHDNRLAMAVLTRLDRQAAGMGEGAAVARTIAQEWDQFLDIVAEGGEGADAFLANRAPAAAEERPAEAGELESAATMLRRLKTYELYEAGLAREIPTKDLDPARMAEWTDEQWQRADLSGFLATIPQDQWPDDSPKLTGSGTNGTCRSRRDVPNSGEGEDERFDIWEDEDEGCWVTNYPPPEDFDGFEEGEWGDEDYKRSLCPGEQAAIDRDLAIERAEEEAELAADLARARAARDRAFGFDPPAPVPPPAGGDASALEGAPLSAISAADRSREGDAE